MKIGIVTKWYSSGQAVVSRHLRSALWDYANTAGIDVQLDIFVDPLSVFMCLVVTGVSFLIHVYSAAYMCVITHAWIFVSAASGATKSARTHRHFGRSQATAKTLKC